MLYLLIDTCTERGMIAYGNHEHLFFEKHLPVGIAQSKFLMPYLFESLAPFPQPAIDAIGVTVGPGSYTGIRLGVAVAQALAYSWKIPLVGISSLEGFIPLKYKGPFAAMIDARIGGVYIQKGAFKDEAGACCKQVPTVIPIEEVGCFLDHIEYIVTPFARTLQAKFLERYPYRNWHWEERAPSAKVLLQGIDEKFQNGQITYPPQVLELLYLRETQAEREKMLNQGL